MTWPRVQVRHVTRFGYGDSLPADQRVDGPVPVYGSNGPVGTHESANTVGTTIVVGRKGSHGRLQFSGEPVFAIDTTYFIDERLTRQDIRWLFYALQTVRLEELSQDVGVPGLNREDAYSQRVPLPSRTEQRAIADFLDTETARIDALIAKKKRMIELVHQRRSVMLAGVLGDGQDPAQLLLHGSSRVLPLKRVLRRTIAGGTPDSATDAFWSDDPNDVAWLSIGDMVDLGRTRQAAKRVTSSGRAAARLETAPPGTVLFAMYASLGKVSVTDVPATWNQAIIGLVPAPQLLEPEFLTLWLEVLRPHLHLLARSNTQANLNAEQVLSLPVPALPLSKQRQVLSELRDGLRNAEVICERLTSQISLLQEHRQALITAAVSGELEVPGVAA